MIALSLIAAAAVATATPSTPGTPLAPSLIGENCDARTRPDVKPAPGLPADILINCADKPAGTIKFVSIGSQIPAGEAGKFALATAFNNSRIWNDAKQKLTCDPQTWLVEGNTLILVMPCRGRIGGWPSLVMAKADGNVLTIADVAPSAYPALRIALKLPPAAGTRVEQVAKIQSFWSQKVVLASAVDIDRERTLLRDARTASSLARYDEAEDLFRKALEIQTRLFGEDDTTAADILIDLALAVSNQGRVDEAEALFRRAAPIMAQSVNPSDRARLSTYRGYEAANRGDFESALANAAAASSAWRTIAAPAGGAGDTSAPTTTMLVAEGELAMTRNLEARMMLRAGNIDGAYVAAGEALLTLDRIEGEPRWWRSDVLVTLGSVVIAQKRVAAAETYFNSALALRQQIFGEGLGTLRVRAALGRAYQQEGLNTSAIVTYRQAFKIAKTLSKEQNPLNNNDLVPFATAITDFAKTLTDDKEKQGLYAEAFDAFQLIRSPLIDKTIDQTSARLAASDPAIAALIRDLQDSDRAVSTARVRLAGQQSLPQAERSAAVEDQFSDAIKTGMARSAEIRKTIDVRFPDFAAVTAPKSLTLDALRARLGPTEAIISFLIGRNRSFVQLVRRESVHVGQIPLGEAEMRTAVKGLRRSLEIQGGSVNDFDLAASNQLYNDLFGDVASALDGIDHIAVVPAGPLSSLPFSLLVTAAPKSDDYRAASWLVNKITVSHTPSLAAFVALRSTRPAKAPDLALLAFANPVLGAPGKGGSAGVAITVANDTCRNSPVMPAELLLSLSSLPDTLQEVQTVARALGADPATSIHQGALANETNFRNQELSRYRILYFATHGLLPGELKCQAEPGMVLTPPPVTATERIGDGLLEASEIAGLSINADLVVLSACNTASGGGALGGESLSGLSEAFFRAGARNMLISHWQVPSGATTSLMSGLFGSLSTAGSSADALRVSQLKLISEERTAHPFFWAAFVLMGDGSGAVPVPAAVQTAEVVK